MTVLRASFLSKNIRAGFPAAPRGNSLVLLPLGPGTVRRSLPRRTRPDGAGGYRKWEEMSIEHQKTSETFSVSEVPLFLFSALPVNTPYDDDDEENCSQDQAEVAGCLGHYFSEDR